MIRMMIRMLIRMKSNEINDDTLDTLNARAYGIKNKNQSGNKNIPSVRETSVSSVSSVSNIYLLIS